MAVRTKRAPCSGKALPALFLALALWSGCERGAPEAQRDLGQFGDAYDILSAPTDAGPDLYPALEQDTLIAFLGYSGGCEDHAFDLSYRTGADTTQLWIQHDAGGDDCEAYLQDELRLHVPAEALQAPTIVLLNPGGGPPHILRWGRSGG